jgi:hypothetical protein
LIADRTDYPIANNLRKSIKSAISACYITSRALPQGSIGVPNLDEEVRCRTFRIAIQHGAIAVKMQAQEINDYNLAVTVLSATA